MFCCNIVRIYCAYILYSNVLSYTPIFINIQVPTIIVYSLSFISPDICRARENQQNRVFKNPKSQNRIRSKKHYQNQMGVYHAYNLFLSEK